MKDYLKKLKTNYGVSALISVVIGIILIFWSSFSVKVIFTVLGGAFLIYGIIQVALYCFNRDKTVFSQIILILGVIFAVIGIFILMKPDMILKLIPIIAGVLIMIHGLHNGMQAIDLKRSGYEKWWIALILGLFTVALGLFLVLQSTLVVNTVVRIIGFCLVYEGISDIWILKKVSKRIIDVDAKDL